jgi:pyruvate carboxylase subunit B
MLPGSVFKILAEAGTAVNEGDKIMILESMKMEVDIIAPCNGVVQSVLVRPNDKVIEGQALAIVG